VSSSLIRQDVLPVGVGYLLVMGALGTGLWLIQRQHRAGAAAGLRPDPEAAPAAGSGGREADGASGVRGREADGASGVRGREAGATAGPVATAAGPRPDWLRLARHYAGTAAGGYLLLMAVVVLYYYGVARVGGTFIASAFTGCALLIALSTPVFALASWLTERRRARPPAGRDPPAPPTPPAS
jgi:hypothetical protein